MVPGPAGRWSQTAPDYTGPSSFAANDRHPTVIIAPMTERGLPIVDGAPACPFVAFEDDRDARAASPDHRHRCYAEVRPAPRALAHQEAYCLSSAFPVCPTFQDWARREAAQARAASAAGGAGASAAAGAAATPAAGAAAAPAAGAAAAGATSAGDGAAAEESAADAGAAGSERNPPRPWSAPPPWSGDPRTAGGGGLSGSMADRLAAGEPIIEAESAEALAAAAGAAALPPAIAAEPRPRPVRPAPPPTENEAGYPSGPRMARPAAPSRRPAMPIDPDAPSWERPRRMEAYPSLRARVGLPTINPPPILLGIVALGLAALALFLLPGFLGLGGPDATGTPNPSSLASAGPSASVEPTPTPAPTQQTYVVQAGDTLSGIAQRFGLTLEALRAANPQITNVDEIKIGDEIIIPAAIPTEIPNAGSPSPAASPSP